MKHLRFVLGTCSVVLAAIALLWQPQGSPEQESPDRRIDYGARVLALDSSGNGYDGVNQGGPEIGLPGLRGTAYSFDEPGSWIQVPSEPALNPYHKDFLVSAWVKVRDAPKGKRTADIIRKGLSFSTGGVYKLELIADGYIKCSAKDAENATGRVIGSEITLTDGKWHHIGCARTGSTWSAIVDETVTSQTVDLGSIHNTMPVSIGSKYGLEDLPKGRVDEVSLTVSEKKVATQARRLLFGPREMIDSLDAEPPTGLWRLDELE